MNVKASPTLYLKLVLVTLFWGGTFIAGRVASQAASTYFIAFGRFLVASLFLMIMLWRRERHRVRLTKRQILLILASSLTGIIAYNIFFLNGLRLIEANRASLIIALNPTVVMASTVLLGMERLTWQRLAGLLIALLGVALVLTEGDLLAIRGSLGLGELLIGGCVVSWAAYTLIGRSLIKKLSPLLVTTYACIAGCAGLLVPAGLSMDTFGNVQFNTWLAIAYLGIFGTGLGFVWFYEGVKTIGPTRASIFVNLVPGWAVLLSALILREEIVATTLMGGLVIVAGVMLANISSTGQKDRTT